MISTSIETHVRGDEGQRCSQLAQLRHFRAPREVKEDFEMLKTPEMAKIKKRLHSKFGRYQEEEVNEEENVQEEPAADGTDGELDGENELLDPELQQGQVDGQTAISQCPVENGVLHSRWGAVAAGTMLAGLAAGLGRKRLTLKNIS